ncbi:MAG: hypothetical protein QXI52_05895 [Nitrososphaerota archaeon]
MEKSKTKRKIISMVGYQVKIKPKFSDYVIDGMIIDETKNMITIRATQGTIKRFPKNAISLYICDYDKHLYLKDGKQIIGTPSERVKRIRRKWAKTLDKR